MTQRDNEWKKDEPDLGLARLTSTRRNPYLAEQRPRTAPSRTAQTARPRTAPSRTAQTARPRTAPTQQRMPTRKRKKAQRLKRTVLLTTIICICLLVVLILVLRKERQYVDGSVSVNAEQGNSFWDNVKGEIQGIDKKVYENHPQWEEDFLTLNEYSRPGDALKEVNSIFVHYTANKGTSAAQNRSYFEQLKDTHERSASAHFIIGYDGEIIQCIPMDEIAYAVMTRNEDSISIECCYLAENGAFTQETYDSLITLLGWLMEAYNLDTDDILRHYDCGGKKCPIYYTEHEDAWEKLKKDVKS